VNRTAELDALIDELTGDAYNAEAQLGGFLVGFDAAIRRGERATIAGADAEVLAVGCGPDARAGVLARVRDGEATHESGFAGLRRQTSPRRRWSPSARAPACWPARTAV
jgi:hypothetical protein